MGAEITVRYPMTARISYNLSCSRLRKLGLLEQDDDPPAPKQVPQPDDEEPLGVSIFRMRLADALDLSDLTLPRTFFGRSEVNHVSFRNSDLHESNLSWNDFVGTDFTEADLGRSDMRSSLFQDVLFVAANLDGADLRRSSFVGCNFEKAAMKGTVLTRQQGAEMSLSAAQRKDVDWRAENGPEPPGG